MKQRGLVMVFALLVLLSLTILGVSAVTSSLSQSKMAMSMQQTGLAFDAAEAAIAGVFFESEDESLLQDSTKVDPLSAARQLDPYDPETETMSCFDENEWTDRYMTEGGLSWGNEHTTNGTYQTMASTKSWSRTAFIREQACRGSSNVIGGSNVNCHVFIIRGCGKVGGKSTVVANSLAASVFGPASQ
ncbi:PilX N-terminal domain-containing pilus assembly protein [Alteromonas stellipolaris]|jgi:type IV pilus assembly protein PilX|uniref:PilX N-terminal domain-containing pilus assembly protein n=1 Tax=Alteromonas stellipolaris TaxID=233316 RepID=UPI002119445D|nr:PilX N-terminal domain-containing pilus assembly protein [Alteromonas stellipolaris]MCQ8849480.1 PilX N-terminal domain-containing pilus assembly protein [Alteromonas stellipolaris]